MKFKFATDAENEIPAGKRTVRQTVRGSVNAYVGGKFWANLGEASEPHTDTLIAEFLEG